MKCLTLTNPSKTCLTHTKLSKDEGKKTKNFGEKKKNDDPPGGWPARDFWFFPSFFFFFFFFAVPLLGTNTVVFAIYISLKRMAQLV